MEANKLTNDENQIKNDEKPEKSGIMGWWNKQGKGMKIGSLVGLCCLGLLVIALISAMGAPDQTTSSDSNSSSDSSSSSSPSSSASTTPKTVTIAQLYGTSISEGTLVKVTGTVLQSDGTNLRIENANGKDILIDGTDLAAYENQKVTVVGTFDGPTAYSTVMGGERTVPHIINAEIKK